MRRSALSLTALVVVASLAACSPSSESPPAESPPSETSTSSATETVTETATETSTETATETATDPADDNPTEVLPEALLAADVLGTADQPREEAAGLTAWLLPERCEQVTPEALDMWTVTQGTGEFEEPVGVHQVAVFADADAATAGAEALVAAMESCAPAEGNETRYVVEPLDVGAQGHGLAIDYYGASDGGDLETALGSYTAATRRGSAVTLTGYSGGENQVAVAREDAAGLLGNAWEQLCSYDSAGC